MPSKKKKFNSRFPPARIKKIMQSDEEVGKVAQVVPIIVSNALESFVKQLLTQSLAITKSRNARTLTPTHIKCTILSKPEFAFLRELASLIPDVNKEGDEEEQEQPQPPNPSVGASFSAVAYNKNGASLSSVTNSGGAPIPSKRGRPRKRPLEEDILATAQPVDYAIRKTTSQYQPSSSSAAALAAVTSGFVSTTTNTTSSNQSIINQPSTSRSNPALAMFAAIAAESEEETDDGAEEDGSEDDEEDDGDDCEEEDEEEEMVIGRGKSRKDCSSSNIVKKVRTNGPNTSSSTAAPAPAPQLQSSQPTHSGPLASGTMAADIDDDYDN